MPHGSSRAWLGLILALSVGVRAYLVVAGGQYYWPDERLYRISQTAARQLLDGEPGAALASVTRADHPLFQVIGVAPATVEHLIGANSRIPALFFSLFSVASIAVIWRIARQLGAPAGEALLAAALMSASTTWLYYSRHLMPYDASMLLGLAAVSLAIDSASSRRARWVSGLVACACVLTYSGYWTLALVALLIATAWRSPSITASLTRGLEVGAAFLMPLATLFAVNTAAGGTLLEDVLSFSRTVSQGEYAEGDTLPFAYLWHAEHFLAVVWLCALLSGLLSGQWTPRRMLALTVVAVIYGALAVTSVGLHRFVVYGRLVRPLVPFLTLVTAEQLYSRLRLRPLPVTIKALAIVGLLLQVAVNWRTPLLQVFPEEFKILAQQEVARLGAASSALLFADHIYPRPVPFHTTLTRVVIREPHPLSFLPYQYEGFTPSERAELRRTDIAMRLMIGAE